MAIDLFRKKALDKISSPEQLDTMIKITSPVNWIALTALAILVFVAILWGIWGSIPTKVRGNGILIDGDRIIKIQAIDSGRISSINVNVGDIVASGQVIARLEQRSLEEKINTLLGKIKYLIEKRDLFDTLAKSDLDKEVAYLKKEELNLDKSIDTLEQNNKWLFDKVSTDMKLREKGIITKKSFYQTQQDLVSNNEKLRSEIAKLLTITRDRSKGLSQILTSKFIDQLEVDKANLELADLQNQLDLKAVITSPVSGRVIEISISNDQVIQSGGDILSLVSSTDEDSNTRDYATTNAIMYFSSSDAKILKRGMKAQIAPLMVKTQEYGYIKGIISHVNELPSTNEGIMSKLQNSALVNQLTAGLAPVEVDIALLPSSETYSGYQWTSNNGPDMKIFNGTLASSYIIVKEKAPISFIVPFFKGLIYGIKDEIDINEAKAKAKANK